MNQRSKPFSQSTVVRAGVPMLLFMIGGCYMLSEFMQTKMEMKDKLVSSQSQRKFDLDEEHKAMLKKLDIERDFTLSRIPRPDDSPTPKKSLQGINEEKKNDNSHNAKTSAGKSTST